jgi:hypothetical protein
MVLKSSTIIQEIQHDISTSSSEYEGCDDKSNKAYSSGTTDSKPIKDVISHDEKVGVERLIERENKEVRSETVAGHCTTDAGINSFLGHIF